MSNTRENDTQQLTNILKSTSTEKELGELITQHLDETPPELSAFLSDKLARSGLSKSEAVRRSGLHRTYAYQIFQGARQPSRDKLIALCIAMGLPLEEVQRALRISGLGHLYSKSRRDAILIFAISNGRSCMDANFLLDEFGEPILE